MNKDQLGLNGLVSLQKEGRLFGSYTSIPNEIYHHKDCPGISKSDLDLIHRSYAHYKIAKDVDNTSTPAMAFGSAFHDLMLEPDKFDEQYVIEPYFNKRTKIGKAEYEQFRSDNEGKTTISQENWDTLAGMKDEFDAHPKIKQILEGAQFETTFFWEDSGVVCKCRADVYRNDGVLIDLKTTVDATRPSFERSVVTYRYDVQAAYYLDGVTAVTGQKYDTFLFIVVEKAPPYGIKIYHANEAIIDVGREIYKSDLNKYTESLQTGNTKYSYDIENLSMSPWGFSPEGR